MKTSSHRNSRPTVFTWLLSLSFTGLLFINGAFAAGDEASPRISLELRDGSRVVGQCTEAKIGFHSALFGNFKLRVQDIRFLDSAATNAFTLSTTSGDTLAVSLLDSALDIKTTFGKVQIPVDSIRKLSVAGHSYESQLPGLVALWSGDGQGKDAVGANDANWTDVAYADGLAGQAFSLNGSSTCAEVPPSPTLDVGAGDGMTLSAWIKPANVDGFHPIMEWEKTTSSIGVQLWIGFRPNSQGVLCANFVGQDPNDYIQVASPPMTLMTGQWQHVAVTYDRNSGVICLYVNGVPVNQQTWGSFHPLTTGPIWISRRPGDHPGDWTYNAFLGGLLDQLAIYNRALSAEEIKAICVQDNHGQMPPVPNPQVISRQSRFLNYGGAMQ